MRDHLRLSNVRLRWASEHEQATGLLGYVTCVVNGALCLDGLTLRRSISGDFSVSFPARTDVRGMRHAYIQALDGKTHREIEAQILKALGLGGRRAG